jgi:hypothetical protein
MMSADRQASDPEMEELPFVLPMATMGDTVLIRIEHPGYPAEVADGWAAALFDLYRGTGQHAEFEQLSMDYAQWFVAAPTWYSTPQILGLECPLLPATDEKQTVAGVGAGLVRD